MRLNGTSRACAPLCLSLAFALAGANAHARPPWQIGVHADDALAAPSVSAGEDAGAAAGFRSWAHGEHLTGDWGGFRNRLADWGIGVESFYALDWSAAWAGGVRDRDTARQLLDVNASFDLERLGGIRGATVFLDAYGHWGRNGSNDIGDFQGASNIDADDDFFQLSEYWWEQYLLGDKLRIKFGKADANSEFAFVDAAGDFLNSSAGFSPTIFLLPTFPDPAMSVNAFVYPTPWLYLGAALYDGSGAAGIATGGKAGGTFFKHNDGYFAIAELGFQWDSPFAGAGRLALGPWFHTADLERHGGGTKSGTEGFYALLEQVLWVENGSAAEDGQGISGFLQYGWADEELSEAAQHVGAGLVWTGALPARDDDAMGLLLSWVDLSDAAGTDFAGNETALEFFYLLKLAGSIGLKADLQYIANPAGQSGAGDVTVGMLRTEITF